MFALLLAVAGIALIVGAKGIANSLVKAAVGALLLVTALPWLVESCAYCVPRRYLGGGIGEHFGALLVVLGLMSIGGLGLLCWRRRVERAKEREIWARRNGTPRTRALPSPPSGGGGEGW